MDDQLIKKLDELATTPTFRRKISFEQTKECPIWNPYDLVWEESDAQFRERILKTIGGK